MCDANTSRWICIILLPTANCVSPSAPPTQVKANLHMVFTASPVGENFRIRSQRFLATVTSTVIDWFQPWPEASLFSVAKKFLDEVDLGEDAIRSAVVEFMPYRCGPGTGMVDVYWVQDWLGQYTDKWLTWRRHGLWVCGTNNYWH